MSSDNNTSKAGPRVTATDPNLRDIVFDIIRSASGLHLFNKMKDKLKAAVIAITKNPYIHSIFDSFRDAVIPIPQQLAGETASILALKEKRYVQDTQNYQEAKILTYLHTTSVCTESMTTHLRSCPDYEVFDTQKDPIALLQQIQRLMSYEGAREDHKIKSMVNGMQNLSKMYQHPSNSDSDIYERFNEMHQVIDRSGGGYGSFSESIIQAEVLELFTQTPTNYETFAKGILSGSNDRAEIIAAVANNNDAERAHHLVELLLATKTITDQRRAASESLKEKCKAMDFLLNRVNKERFGKMVEELDNTLSLGEDKFPKTVAEAYRMVLNRKDKQGSMKTSGNTATSGAVTLAAVNNKGKPGSKQKTVNGGSEQPNSNGLSKNQKKKWRKQQLRANVVAGGDGSQEANGKKNDPNA